MRSRGPSPTTWYAMFRSPLLAYRVSGRADGIQPPLSRNALQLVGAALVELDSRTGHEVLDRGGDEHFTRLGERGDPRSRRDRDPAELAVDALELAGVEAGPHLEPERADRVANRGRALDRAPGPVEGREEAVARRVQLLAAEAHELAAHERVVARQQLAPRSVAELCSPFGRADDVCEHDRREHAVRRRRGREALDEVLCLT